MDSIFIKQGEESRERLADEFRLKEDPVKFERLQTEGRRLMQRSIPLIERARSGREAGLALSAAFKDVRDLFPGDEYGERALQALARRAKEKMEQEVAAWLGRLNRPDLARSFQEDMSLTEGVATLGLVIDNVLAHFPNKAELFRKGLQAKVSELNDFFTRGF